jgi:hypothetical protein
MMMKRFRLLFGVLASGAMLFAAASAYAGWEPAAYVEEDVLEFYTITEDGDEHWAKVWLVVLDDDVYIRLGNRAGKRIDGNVEKPYVKIRIAGEEFDKVLLEDAPDQVEPVAELMGEKYCSDVLIKYVAHPYTFRLVVQE